MKRANSIFYSAMMLTGANLLLRLVSMGFQVYLSRQIGAGGIGLLQLIFSVSGLSFTMGAAGVRTCAMYLSAGELGRGHPQGVFSVLSGCFRYSLIFSVTAALGLWSFAPAMAAGWIGNPAAEASLRTYALFLPAACLYGVLSGYFTAAGRIRDLVLIEFLEQGCSMAVTLLLLFRWAGDDSGRACQSVVAGGCCGTLLSFCLLMILSRRRVPKRDPGLHPPYKKIVKTALPLGLTDNLRSGLNALENLIVPRRLALFAGTADAMADYGTVCGMVFPVLMFPAAILFSLAELLVPEFSRCHAGNRRVRLRYLTRRSLRVALLFGLCAGGVLFVCGDSLGNLLYGSPAAGAYLRLYAPLVPMLYADAVVDAMCKGLGQQNANARYNTLTSFLDVTFLWLLLPRCGLGGYYLSFGLTHAVNFALSLRRLMIASGVTPGLSLPLRALFCAVSAAFLVSRLPQSGDLWGMLLSAAAYLLLLFFLWSLCRVVGRRDIHWLRGLLRGPAVG